MQHKAKSKDIFPLKNPNAPLAFSSALSNVPNAKYLAHQTQKWTLIRCAKCLNILKHAIVRSQI